MEEVYISLGSNKGDRQQNINKAIEKIRFNGIKIDKVSKKYITEPWGKKDQNDFLNCAAKLKTELSPWELIKIFQKIELQLGKKIIERWGERTVDIDIVFYGKKNIYEKNLIIPHPRFHLRKFVLIPLYDISKNIVDPVSGLTIEEILINTEDKSIVKIFNEN
ncbi:MAG TPA: 2-amino-4-hydroxy-6-hydroxymethyldihydropteridine diphosphokinase [Bacteroidetes bacterium]|nr:2-amino-4-hydroxy-6-hydroxymethyldihydropteridine diphosphokinase [Bacteroidota bacterium]